MKKISDSNENEMVLAFLMAEIDSPRFGPAYLSVLSNSKLARKQIIDDANLQDAGQNDIRMQLLSLVRGYRTNQFLFAGFPEDATWSRYEINLDDLSHVRYANYPTWASLSGGSRQVIDGAKNIDSIQVGENTNVNIKVVAEEVKKGKRHPDLITAQHNNGFLILIEGHTRATAYALAKVSDPIKIFVGSSPIMDRWIFY